MRILTRPIMWFTLALSLACIFLTTLIYYKETPKGSIVCKFDSWTDASKYDRLTMNLKCDDKKYTTSDPKLVLFYIKNPDKEMKVLLYRGNYVRSN